MAPLPCTCTHEGRRRDADGLCFTCGGTVLADLAGRPVDLTGAVAIYLATPGGHALGVLRRRFTNRDAGAEPWPAIVQPSGDPS